MLEDFVGHTLSDKYELIEVLSMGGMGAVFRAHDLELDREVAVKIIRPERALSPRAIDDFVKEARIIARLDHPHILPVYGLDKTQFAACPVYLVMKLAKGGTLFDKLQEGAPQPEEALRILRQVSEGLDYAHNQGVVHLDLKPHNILFDDRGNVLVGDFGLAKLLESATHVKADTGVGTSAYMPPEQFTGSNAGRFSDVFALGLTLHEMLTGHLPDRDYDPDRQQEYIVVDPSLPERVAHVIRKATERNPTQRYQTAGQLVEAFAAALKQPVTAEDPISTADESHLLETILHRLEQECVLRGIKTTSKEERGAFFRVRITDHQSEVLVDLYRGKRGIQPKLGGRKDSDLYSTVEKIIETVFGTPTVVTRDLPRRSFVVRDPREREKVAEGLRNLGSAEAKQEANCDYRLDFAKAGERVIVRQYSNGNLMVQCVAMVSEVSNLFDHVCQCIEKVLGTTLPTNTTHEHGPSPPIKQSSRSMTVVSNFDIQHPFAPPWIGTDESGKGDYFGPLVSAAVYVNEFILEELSRLGVRDSKLLSDGQNRKLAEKIRSICKGLYCEVVIRPEKYNELYEQFRREGKTLTLLLAWCHARALEDLLDVVDCTNVITDQFADKRYLQSRLLAKGRSRELNLVQTPKAEANLAVAAASILARDKFLSWLGQESERWGIAFPKGASQLVINAARAFVDRNGEIDLGKVAKLHFKTTASVLTGH